MVKDESERVFSGPAVSGIRRTGRGTEAEDSTESLNHAYIIFTWAFRFRKDYLFKDSHISALTKFVEVI